MKKTLGDYIILIISIIGSLASTFLQDKPAKKPQAGS
jgi:hypothetical protein